MLKNYVFQRPVGPAATLASGGGARMQPMVNNQQRPDSMPDWQEAGVGVHNGVGGAPGTHEGHARVVPMRDDMTTPGDDQTGYGAA